MKKLLTVFLLFLTLTSNAAKIDAVLVDSKGVAYGVTLKVRVNTFSNEVNCMPLQKKIVFYNKSGKKFKLRPNEISSLSFEHSGRKYNMVSVNDNLTYSRFNKILLLLEQDGYLKRYTFFEQRSNGGYYGAGGMYMSAGSRTVEVDVLQKGNNYLFRVRPFRFKKTVSEYFSDFPELSERIKSKEFRKEDLLKIIDIYNKWYNHNHSL